jgi:ribose transport system permease protein
MMARLGISVFPMLIVALLAGAILGLFNGFVIHEFKIAPFIATLGSAAIIRGLIKLLCDAKTITGIYPKFANFSDDRFIGIPKMAWVWLLVAFVAWLVLRYTRFGRNTFTIGCGEEVARLSGIDLRLNKYAIYMVAGIMCSIAGVLLTSRINSAIPTGGAGYEMNAIAAAVIGGASLSGGRGSIIGTIIGTLLMTMISNGGIQLGVDPFIMEIVTGFLIIIAVIIDTYRSRRK